MRIVVTIKQILDPEGITVNRRRERIFTDKAEPIINPVDRRALEMALRLKDAHDAEVIAVSLGPAGAEDALREALALGADAAYLLSGAPLEEVDAPAAARALAQAIRMIGGYDLVLVGQAAADTSAGEIGGRLAELLDLPQVSQAIEAEIEGETLRAVRLWNGARVRVAAPMPALAAVSTQAPPARYPHGARILNAYRASEVTVWSAGDLGLPEDELAPITESRGLVFPPERELGHIVRGTSEEAAREVAALIRARRLA